MSTFAEKLSGVEEQIRTLRTKIDPLAEKADGLKSFVDDISSRVKTAEQESGQLVDELNGMRSGIDSLLSVLSEANAEGVQIDAKQKESQELHDSLTEMFGEAFQVVSRFFDTAQKLGLVDKGKTPKFLEKNELEAIKEAMAEPETAISEPEAAEAVVAEAPVAPEPEAVTPEPAPETVEVEAPVVAEPEAVTPEPEAEPVEVEVPVMPEPEAAMPEPEAEPVVAEAPAVPEPEAATPENSSDIFSEADFAPPVSAAETEDMPSFPSLPDVTFPADELPTMSTGESANAENDADNSVGEGSLEEMAGSLDLPPLALGTPAETTELPETTPKVNEEEEQKIEDLLSDLSKPIST